MCCRNRNNNSVLGAYNQNSNSRRRCRCRCREFTTLYAISPVSVPTDAIEPIYGNGNNSYVSPAFDEMSGWGCGCND